MTAGKDREATALFNLTPPLLISPSSLTHPNSSVIEDGEGEEEEEEEGDGRGLASILQSNFAGWPSFRVTVSGTDRILAGSEGVNKKLVHVKNDA